MARPERKNSSYRARDFRGEREAHGAKSDGRSRFDRSERSEYGRSGRPSRPARFDGGERGEHVFSSRSNDFKKFDGRRRPAPSHRDGDDFAARKNGGERPAHRQMLPAVDDLCWGRNPVLTLLRSRPELCRRVRVMIGAADDFSEAVVKLCAEKNIALEFAERDVLDQVTGGAVHQGVVANMNPIPPADLDDIVDAIDPQAPALIVLLDHCQDPHNLGAVIRTAEIAGASCVVTQNNRSATVNGTVVKTSAGAAFRLPVAQIVNVNRAIERLKAKGFWVVGLDHRTAETVWSSPLPERLVLVVGSEGEGIAPLVLKNCDKLVKFPMAGKTGNLNASVAAALGMFEWVRLHGVGKLQ